MADGDKLVRYITQQVVSFLETPRTTRVESRKRDKSSREQWAFRWFGLVPFALSFWYKKVKKKRRRAGI
ncbi:MAG: YqzE family protein [Paenibacillaceae bacterium]